MSELENKIYESERRGLENQRRFISLDQPHRAGGPDMSSDDLDASNRMREYFTKVNPHDLRQLESQKSLSQPHMQQLPELKD